MRRLRLRLRIPYVARAQTPRSATPRLDGVRQRLRSTTGAIPSSDLRFFIEMKEEGAVNGQTYAIRAERLVDQMLVDTGADLTGISEAHLAEIEAKAGTKAIVRTRPGYTAAGVSELKYLPGAKVCLSGRTKERPFRCCTTTDLLVLPDLHEGVLLGRDLMTSCGTSIDLARDRVCFGPRHCRSLLQTENRER